MAIVVQMPKLTDTMEEGVLIAWRKQEGEAVNVDDVLGEVETDKATMELCAYDKGVLLRHLIAAGDSVPPGTPIAIVGKAGENIDTLLAQVGKGAPAPAAGHELESPLPQEPADRVPGEEVPGEEVPGEEAPGEEAPGAKSAAAVAPRATQPPARDGEGRVLASPLARRLAREQGVDLDAVAGSGPGGRIVARDLEGAATGSVPSAGATASAARSATPATSVISAKVATGATSSNSVTTSKPLLGPQTVRPMEFPEPQVQDGKVVPHSNMRKTIARRLTDSKTGIPHYYVTMAFDADPMVEFRARANADATNGVKISVNDILIKAVAKALKEVPRVNTAWTEAGLVYHQRSDIGFAVAIDDGLITPVVRQADKKTLGEIATEVADLIKRARLKRLKPEEFRNGTFSISNLGMYGVSHFAAVINPPEAAILAVGAVQRLPVVRGDAVVPGNVLKVTMSCDHRVIDGAVAAQFLAALRELLEHPMRLVL